MLKKVLLGSLLTAILCATVGCLEGLTIKAGGNPSAPTFELERETTCKEAVVRVFQVVAIRPGEYEHREMWSMDQSPSSKERLVRFKYGTPPEGFRTIGESKPLVEGHAYRISLRCGRFNGHGLFTLTRVDGRVRLENIDAKTLGDFLRS